MADQQQNKLNLEELSVLLSGSSPNSQSITDEEYVKGLLRTHDQVVERSSLLTTLLKNYIESHKSKVSENQWYKCIIFAVFIAVFISFSFVTLCKFKQTDLNSANISQIVSLLSIGATYIGSIFVAYEIMFKYLFSTDEEKDMISMIQTVIENDLKVEEFTSTSFTNRTTSPRGDPDQNDGNA